MTSEIVFDRMDGVQEGTIELSSSSTQGMVRVGFKIEVVEALLRSSNNYVILAHRQIYIGLRNSSL
jgi:hypothetical protein